jgi:hypothetical protein
VQQKWNALLMVFQWSQLIRKASHNIYEGALAGFGSCAAPTEVAGEQGMDFIYAMAGAPEKSRVG